MEFDLTQAIELPPLWVPVIAAIVIPWLNAFATQSVDDETGSEREIKWERRLRKMFAGMASLLVVALSMLIEGPMDLAEFLPALFLAYGSQRGSWAITKEFAVNPNKLVMPKRGLSPVTVAFKAQRLVDSLALAA